MPLGWLFSTASEITSPVWDAVRSLAMSPADRRIWATENRTHLEVHGVHQPDNAEAARELEQRLGQRDGVRTVEVNAVLGRVVIGHDPSVISSSALADVVAEVEQEYELGQHGPAPAGVRHPGDPHPILREVGALGGSVVGLAYAFAMAALPPRSVPAFLPAMTSLVDSVPWLRSTVEGQLGREATDITLAVAGVASHTLAQNPLALITHSCRRVCTAREATARREAWRRWEKTMGSEPGAHHTDAFDLPPRPTPLPDGPVERTANISGGLALAGYGTTLVATRNSPRATAALGAGIPCAGAGREAFSAQVSSALSHRGELIIDPDALRRMDRVTLVLLDSPILMTGRKRLHTVTLLDPEGDTTTLFERANELIDIRRPQARSQRGRWATAPLSDFGAELPQQANAAASEAKKRGGTTMVLLEESRPVAIVGIETELDPLAEAIIDAARTAGSIVIAGVGSRLEHRLAADRVVPGGNRLLESVRRLQVEGHVVAVVSARSHAALAGADVGIGLPGPTGATPWGAHIACTNASAVHTLLSAIARARLASRNSATLSIAGSCTGVLFGALGPAYGAATRASIPVQAATLLALGTGTWAGVRATNLPPPAVRSQTPWHAMPSQTVLGVLGSSAEGISETEAKRRQQPTEPVAAEAGITQATIEGLVNPMTAILGAGAAVSASLGSIIDAGMIMFVLGASALIDGVQQVSTHRELAQLLKAGELPARLRRDGVVRTVSAATLVPGDIVELHAGDGVPADCRILQSDNVELDESSLTGESQLVAKSAQATGAPLLAERTSMLYQGTLLATGRATAVVVATGLRTELGSTTQDMGENTEISGVEARLSSLTRSTLPISASAGGALMLADLLRGNPLGLAISRAVGLAVAAVPEGLPFVATVAETAAARRLANRGVLVRSPKTIEALGRVDALCFDKTGTLTQGRISLRQVSDGTGSSFVDELDPWLREVVTTAVHASPEQDDRPLPHPTDRAVLEGAERAGVTAKDGPGAWEVLADLPFEPSRGYHAVRAKGPVGQRVSVKGAPEVVLDRCARWRRPTSTIPFDLDSRTTVDEEVERLAQGGYRVLAVAERTATGRKALDEPDIDNLEFVGLLALADPVHPTASEAVSRLRTAGVAVVMITGDHPSTAEAIAAELDMLRGKRVVNGAELDTMDDDQLAADIPKIAVFARVSPAQKARIVRQLRRADRIVAMTGDGANDVPAIKLAQVGIALGTHATPAAREAADLVITDDRIETITEAIVEGRGMWASVHDALSILLGGNLGEIAFTLGAGILGTQAAPNTRQLLVINLLTDILPALAIAVRPPPDITAEQLLAEGPEASLGAALTRDVYARATATASGAGVAWLLARPVGTAGQARTAGLVSLVSGQLGQTLAMRGRTPLVLVAGAGSMLILATVVQVPGVSQFFGNQPLLPHQWFIALGSATAATAGVTLWQAWPPDTRV